MKKFGLGRFYVEDSRDSNYLMASVLPEKEPSVTKRNWDSIWMGDQGHNPYCVAFAWLHWMADEPVVHRSAPIYRPRDVYFLAQKLDSFPGENYQGTTVRAGAKTLKRYGVITEYRWAWDIETVIDAVLTLGPVVVGTDWHEDMYYPNEAGYIDIGGGRRGGHAYVLSGVDTIEEYFLLKNSWGTDWGEDGFARITIEDMETLLGNNGEACIAKETKLEKYK